LDGFNGDGVFPIQRSLNVLEVRVQSKINFFLYKSWANKCIRMTVTALQFPVHQSIEGVIESLHASKIYKLHNCFKIRNILRRITSIKTRRLRTSLKFVKKFLSYIT